MQIRWRHDRHGDSRFDCHISVYRLKIHTSDNFPNIHNDGINLFTLSNCREMCSLQRFSSRGCLMWSWAGQRTFFRWHLVKIKQFSTTPSERTRNLRNKLSVINANEPRCFGVIMEISTPRKKADWDRTKVTIIKVNERVARGISNIARSLIDINIDFHQLLDKPWQYQGYSIHLVGRIFGVTQAEQSFINTAYTNNVPHQSLNQLSSKYPTKTLNIAIVVVVGHKNKVEWTIQPVI